MPPQREAVWCSRIGFAVVHESDSAARSMATIIILKERAVVHESDSAARLMATIIILKEREHVLSAHL